MAIVSRKRRSGAVVHYVVFSWHGRDVWEKSGTDHREARRLERQRRREVRDGTYVHQVKSGAATVKRYAGPWLDGRKNRTARDDRQRLRDHVLSRPWFADMAMIDVRPTHVKQLVDEMQAGRALAESTIGNAYGVLRTMFRDAVMADLIPSNPCILARGTIKRTQKKERVPFTPEEATALMHDERVTPDSQVFNAIALYGGMREGEICGRRWSDWDREVAPLTCLCVLTQYDGQPLKTGNPRKVPVHPELERRLDWWWREGFEFVYGHRPQEQDFIVPMRRSKHSAHRYRPHHTKSSAYKAFARSCKSLGIEGKSLHCTRHTMITWARRGGARKEILEKVTHNATGDVVDQYTHFDWEPLCEAVMCLSFDARPNLRRRATSSGHSGGASVQAVAPNGAESHGMVQSPTASIPGASTKNTSFLAASAIGARAKAETPAETVRKLASHSFGEQVFEERPVGLLLEAEVPLRRRGGLDVVSGLLAGGSQGRDQALADTPARLSVIASFRAGDVFPRTLAVLAVAVATVFL